MKTLNRLMALGLATIVGGIAAGCASDSAALGPTGSSSGGPEGMTSASTSPPVEELHRFVLVIHESSPGYLTHRWHSVEEFEFAHYKLQTCAERTDGRIVPASAARQRDCHAELLACVKKCMRTPLPPGFGHIRAPGRGMGAKEVYCNEQCQPAYLDCEELQERRPQELSAVDGAVDWLKRNHNLVLAGSVVTVAGVAFIVAFPPGALIALVPLTALASSEVMCEPHLAAVEP
jgi:hypothetical protein